MRYYEIEFDVALPRSIVVKAHDALAAREAALAVISEAVGEVMSFLMARDGGWRCPTHVGDLRVSDTWGHVPPMREDSVGVYDAQQVLEGCDG